MALFTIDDFLDRKTKIRHILCYVIQFSLITRVRSVQTEQQKSPVSDLMDSRRFEVFEVWYSFRFDFPITEFPVEIFESPANQNNPKVCPPKKVLTHIFSFVSELCGTQLLWFHSVSRITISIPSFKVNPLYLARSVGGTNSQVNACIEHGSSIRISGTFFFKKKPKHPWNQSLPAQRWQR